MNWRSAISSCIIVEDDRRECVVSQKSKCYCLKNDSKKLIAQYRIDQCVNRADGEKRCDFLFAVNEQTNRSTKKDPHAVLKKAIFIELKGKAMNDALNQIYNTVMLFWKDFQGCDMYARIVGTGGVGPQTILLPSFKKLEKKIGRRRIRINTGGRLDESLQQL